MPNSKILEQKKEAVKAMAEKVRNAKAVILADYRGLTVAQDTEMRAALRKAGIEYKVVKNSITRFAARENGLEDIIPYLEGPTAMAISDKDPVSPAKTLAEFAKKHEKFSLKAGIVEGKVITPDGIKALAELPPREVLVARVLGGLKSPVYGLANVLNANLRGLVVALKAVAEQKA
ncbi:MAG TPA: 50S ribosomal protein L10 [Clostridiales bacterium]|nr:50S ribosomal protein L10 [Clostridiales bacterium]